MVKYDLSIKYIPKPNIRKLLEICEIFSGGTPSTKNEKYWNGTIAWLTSGETRNNFITQTTRKITVEGIKNSSTRLANKNDVVVASAGQGHTRGQVSFCLIDTYVNQSVIVLRANTQITDPKFLFYNLKSRYTELRRLSDAHSSRGSLPKNILLTLDMVLPPLVAQKKIGKMLYDLDIKMQNLQKQNKILEQIAQAIFKSWFVDFDGVTEFEDLELGKIPKGWQVVPFEKLARCVKGFSYKGVEKFDKPREFAFITLNSIKEGGGFKKKFKWLESNRLKERHFLNEMDLIIANTEQTKDARLLATPAFVQFSYDYEKQSGVYSHHISKIEPKIQNLKFYLYSFFLYYQQNIANAYHTGTGVWGFDHVNFEKNFFVRHPPTEMLEKFEQITLKLHTKIIVK